MTAARRGRPGAARERLSWLALAVLMAAFILVPFALAGGGIEQWTADLLVPGRLQRPALAGAIALLLAADVVLPVPSSLLSMAAGYLLGMAGGTLVSFAGMTCGSLAGYWIGARLGRPAATRLVGEAQLRAMERRGDGRGLWVLAAARPVPVLAEASVLLAGIARIPLRRFLAVCVPANLGVSLVYAAAGALSATAGSFFFALAAALLLPAAAWGVTRRRDMGPRSGARG